MFMLHLIYLGWPTAHALVSNCQHRFEDGCCSNSRHPAMVKWPSTEAEAFFACCIVRSKWRISAHLEWEWGPLKLDESIRFPFPKNHMATTKSWFSNIQGFISRCFCCFRVFLSGNGKCIQRSRPKSGRCHAPRASQLSLMKCRFLKLPIVKSSQTLSFDGEVIWSTFEWLSLTWIDCRFGKKTAWHFGVVFCCP